MKTTTTPVDKNQLYDLQTLDVMKRVLTKKSNCIDVGSHVGSFLREMLRFAPNGAHVAFEPIPQLYDRLLKSFSSYSNVKMYELALSNTAGETTFQHVVSNPAYSGFRIEDMTGQMSKSKKYA